MGSGTSSLSSYEEYSTSRGLSFDRKTGRRNAQEFHARCLDSSLDPKEFTVRNAATLMSIPTPFL